MTAAGTTTYGYDALGRQADRTAAGTTTSYLYDGLNAVQEKAGTATAHLLTGGVDEVFARNSGSLLTDALGSTIASADTSSVAGECTYDPFGTTTVTGDDQGNPARFAGRSDEGNGLYQYRNRFCSTAGQRFLSRDPLGLASGGTNPYAYVNNQPTMLTDPSAPSRRAAAACRTGNSRSSTRIRSRPSRRKSGSRRRTVPPPARRTTSSTEITNWSGHYHPNDNLKGFRPIEEVARKVLGEAGVRWIRYGHLESLVAVGGGSLRRPHLPRT
jgi:RHS repeat-associated protein